MLGLEILIGWIDNDRVKRILQMKKNCPTLEKQVLDALLMRLILGKLFCLVQSVQSKF